MYQVFSKLLHLLAMGSFGDSSSSTEFYNEIPLGQTKSDLVSGDQRAFGNTSGTAMIQQKYLYEATSFRIRNPDFDDNNLEQSMSKSLSFSKMFGKTTETKFPRELRQGRTMPGPEFFQIEKRSESGWSLARLFIRLGLLLMLVPTALHLTVNMFFAAGFSASQFTFSICAASAVLSWMAVVWNILDAYFNFPEGSVNWEITFWTTLTTFFLTLLIAAEHYYLKSIWESEEIRKKGQTTVYLVWLSNGILLTLGIIRYFFWTTDDDQNYLLIASIIVFMVMLAWVASPAVLRVDGWTFKTPNWVIWVSPLVGLGALTQVLYAKTVQKISKDSPPSSQTMFTSLVNL